MEWSPSTYKLLFLILTITVSICVLVISFSNLTWTNYLSFWQSEDVQIHRLPSYMDFLPGADVLGPFQLHQWYHSPDPNWTELEPQIIDGYKTVLFWMNHEQALYNRGAELFSGCPESRCIATTKRKFFNQSAAVVFVATHIHPGKDPKPSRAHSGQVFVFMTGESPRAVSFNPSHWILSPNLFNWTMTYRLDSDIRSHYTYKVPLESNARNFAREKIKKVAWIVSHCGADSRRDDYVAELKKHISVDVYGLCGNLTCSRSSSCLDVLRDYKFYLSFENSMCKDYITEKFTNAFQYETVPIVLGDGNYRIFPPHSYIHTYDFSAPASLAEYLLILDKNDTAYNEYMQWRFTSELTQSYGKYAASQNGFCRLCQMLYSNHRFPKTYPHVRSWWWKGKRDGREHCRGGEWLLQNITALKT